MVDTFDVITHERPYKKAKSARWAFWELRRVSGTQFDPKMVENFIAFMGGGPNGIEPDPYDLGTDPPDRSHHLLQGAT